MTLTLTGNENKNKNKNKNKKRHLNFTFKRNSKINFATFTISQNSKESNSSSIKQNNIQTDITNDKIYDKLHDKLRDKKFKNKNPQNNSTSFENKICNLNTINFKTINDCNFKTDSNVYSFTDPENKKFAKRYCYDLNSNQLQTAIKLKNCVIMRKKTDSQNFLKVGINKTNYTDFRNQLVKNNPQLQFHNPFVPLYCDYMTISLNADKNNLFLNIKNSQINLHDILNQISIISNLSVVLWLKKHCVGTEYHNMDTEWHISGDIIQLDKTHQISETEKPHCYPKIVSDNVDESFGNQYFKLNLLSE
ncbi:uncharacterized protein ASCRUDRAFT_6538 [Ascoidea rubescens DSM 1968]|uniref:Uncharacterized protein n=1 Tax=Ascoidea rubescens DSM 1968 TaxID=1344418 RepID=A0A1D2VMS8_9ASCO|nr:hypothetical protein ASCRUDRAFT_6538 [Ascoidea rubescens DSM 1968]ODV62916.1 hypothetical protein ASCRUDRAFT_6538 [Ascoidea rubescens DSM 1968]